MRVYHTSKETTISKIFKICEEYRNKHSIPPDTIELTEDEYNSINSKYFRRCRKHTIEEMEKGYVVRLDDMEVKIVED